MKARHFRRFIQRYNMKQHIKTHRIELMASDQKPGSFPLGKKGRPTSLSSPSASCLMSFSVSKLYLKLGLLLSISKLLVRMGWAATLVSTTCAAAGAVSP